MRCEHGGYVYENDISLDFSVNISPLGVPESVVNAAKKAAGDCERYPDPFCGELTKRLALLWGVSENRILCGNGAADLIFRTVNAVKPKKAVIAAPCFSEYKKALLSAGCEITEHRLDESADFRLDGSIADKLDEDTDMLILCSPNNPTGRLIDSELLKRISRICEEKHICFLLDECFAGLSDDDRGCVFPAEYEGGYTILLRAFTKLYAMPGLRLGYAVFASEELCRRSFESGQYWSVSNIAQAAGAAALSETGYVRKVRGMIPGERRYLSEGLRSLGMKVYPSDANFILFRSELPLYDGLLKKGILIRDCFGFTGLDGSFYRTAVRKREENELLLAALEDIVKWQKK